ncbi:hypothetical protein ASF56_21740 [Methylobacterium sp. Leaf122]|nr:hypothetical protein [Methylobacterium sp. Leaf122]KQQ19560.1 hypothetical protein ASF56_21740 [Methylobacterium sp. Leaf122]
MPVDDSGNVTMHILSAGIATTFFVSALSCLSTLAAAKPAKPTLPLAPYDGFWAPNLEQCRGLDPRLHQRIRFDAEENSVYDGRALDVGCIVEKAKVYPTGVNLDLICEIGQESPFNFRTDISILRTGPRKITITNSFVDRKPETLDLVRCGESDLPKPDAASPVAPVPSPHYVLPPLREGEFYAGQAYPADYAERRTELLGAKATPLPRTPADTCTQPFCKRYPEIRACYADYCVGRWERADGATVDYVVRPDDLTVLQTVCRDTCGADEIRPQAR